MDTQFKKGVLELGVLSLLTKNDNYGYELVEKISKTISISEGTIYPLLRRLQKEGYLKTYFRESKEGPSRKYYQLTRKGKDRERELREEWKSFGEKIKKLME
jgi:PadR family transcriptional regulator PadR